MGVLARPFPGVLSLFPNLMKQNVPRLTGGTAVLHHTPLDESALSAVKWPPHHMEEALPNA